MGGKVFVSKQHQEAQQCNANLPTLSVHGNPTDAAKTPGLLRNLFPCVFLHCFANLEDVIVWPGSDINNCGSPIYLFFFFHTLKAEYSICWRFAVCCLFILRKTART